MSKLRPLLFLIPCLQPKAKHHKMSKKFPTNLAGFGYGFHEGIVMVTLLMRDFSL